MTVFEKFEQLDDEATYVSIVKEHFKNAFSEITKYAKCEIELDEDRLRYAHGEYVQSIASFAVLLDSNNPDQYKRAGALLHSLYRAAPIIGVTPDPLEIDKLEMNQPVGISYEDAQHRLGLVGFLVEYANQTMAFDLAFRCCQLYEDANRVYDYDFLHNMAYYLEANSSLSVASLAMIFKAYMA